jgi:UDP-glucose 6-dehydrogenase
VQNLPVSGSAPNSSSRIFPTSAATAAAAFASKNVVVKAYDINENTIKKINLGRPAVYEPGLKEFYLKFNKKILGFYSAGDCIDGTDITFVVTPTPSLPNGSFNLEYTNNSFRDIALSIKKKKNFHLIVLVSTVLPGSFSKVLINTLEFYSKKKNKFGFWSSL